METVKTLKLRIKDKHAGVLSAMSREVNQVWNYCNETSSRAIRKRREWLSGFDLQKLTAGYSTCEGVRIGNATVQRVCEEYATRLNWRVSNSKSAKYSLGWVPFKAGGTKYKAGQIAFAGHKFSLWDSYGLSRSDLRAGSFSQDARGPWYLNVCGAPVPSTWTTVTRDPSRRSSSTLRCRMTWPRPAPAIPLAGHRRPRRAGQVEAIAQATDLWRGHLAMVFRPQADPAREVGVDEPDEPQTACSCAWASSTRAE